MVLFAQHDVLLDPPFTRLDLLACRNLLIYFDDRAAAPAAAAVPLQPASGRRAAAGHLGNGGSLQPAVHADQLQAADLSAPGQGHCDRPRLPCNRVVQGLSPPRSPMSPPPVPRRYPGDNLQQAADQVLLQVYAPAAVVVSADGDIVYISGRTGKYLEPAAGKANWNFHAMVRDGLRAPSCRRTAEAATQREPVQLPGLKVQTPGGAIQAVDVTVQALQDSAALKGMFMVVFRDVSRRPDPSQPAPVTIGGAQRRAAAAPQDEIRRCASRSTGLPGRAAVDQRGAAVDQRGTAVCQRGTDDLEGGNAVDERGAADHQCELQTKLDDLRWRRAT
jgi:two-component system, chemotaxis family, CheB/CheR fusion protein